MLMAVTQSLGVTRMSLPFMLGTMFTPDRDRARLIGFAVHLANGWWLGAVIGLFHALFVLSAIMPILPSFHPRMASEQRGPTATRQLQPPGFLALNYGHRTPISVLLAHLIYGGILGAFYRVA
jgi:hypothetical protein